MKWALEEKTFALSIGVIILLLGLINQISSKNTSELLTNANQIQHTYEILGNLTDFFAAMSIAESGRRGYIFSGRNEDLGRYRGAVIIMRSELDQLQNQIEKDVTQQSRLNVLNGLVSQRLSLLEESISLYQRDRSPSAMQAQKQITDRSVLLRERIQATLTDIKDEENQQLQQSLAITRTNIQARAWIERWGTLLGCVIILGLIYIFYWEQQRKKKLQLLEQALIQERELSDLKLRLFSMISHEFRTPLSVILASSQLLEEILETQIESQYLKNLGRIQSSAKLMNHLLTDILTLTRAEAGKLDHKPEPLDIEAFCLNLLDSIQIADTKFHQFQFTCKGDCNRTFFDEKLLYSILNNLLLNAIKYSSPESPIHLTLQCEENEVSFMIQDQGIGILREDIDKVFDPFYRGQNVESVTGSGLGLAVVQKCLELCNGTIHIQSEVGTGTTFIVKLPRHL
ncbi:MULTISPECIES: ATP-binding protein [unclassified Leptolyngbya]|uniref:sensor histidine kinase n=1 Tax=unclassified Leptolyngbya TaxID=2650499 RepID=UPI001686E34D|nr:MULTISPECIES: ATP-binding protein [unclassified Leptolyngbya]MBD1912833.1 CHASE3 domain-containing protein [Leptolyngbya sp. FACHB-8]MBD2157780.1 CHASE3 domain-containing protein [Leptolyngbya sp. FACHB-16]